MLSMRGDICAKRGDLLLRRHRHVLDANDGFCQCNSQSSPSRSGQQVHRSAKSANDCLQSSPWACIADSLHQQRPLIDDIIDDLVEGADGLGAAAKLGLELVAEQH